MTGNPTPETEPGATEEVAPATEEAAETFEAAEGATENTEVTEPVTAGPAGPIRCARDWCGRHWVALLLSIMLVVSAGAAGGVYWWMYRPDRATDAAAQKQVTDAARDGTVALLSYAPDTIDKDLAAAKSHLTGEFLKYYTDFTDKVVAPASRQKGVRTEASVIREAVSEMHPDRAVVLVFVNQVTTSKERPDPAMASSSVMVTMVRSGDRWLISEFNPV